MTDYQNRTLKELLQIATAKTHSQIDLRMKDRATAEIVRRWCVWCEDKEHYRTENGYREAFQRFLEENGIE
jgi:hypothetical protein